MTLLRAIPLALIFVAIVQNLLLVMISHDPIFLQAWLYLKSLLAFSQPLYHCILLLEFFLETLRSYAILDLILFDIDIFINIFIHIDIGLVHVGNTTCAGFLADLAIAI